MMRLAFALVLLIGCGGGTTTPPGDDDVDSGVAPDGWTDLIGRDWDVPPGSADTYKCRRIEITEDMWITGFRAIAPVGTHHTVVTFSNNSTVLGDYDCSVGSLDFQMLYASGVGTDELMFPTGVAMKLRAGQFLNLNLHLFNASDVAIGGTSGIQVARVAESEVVHEADMTFAGTMNISIPPDGQPHIATGGCSVPAGGWNVFTLWPHMHQFATHHKFVATPTGGAPQVLLDTDYQFAEQLNYPMSDTFIPAGTRVDTTCTFVNNGTETVTFGDSSNQEMCFTGLYKYPAGGNLFQCAFN
jgi:hypothetical protein